MTREHPPARIGILGHVGTKNLGDEAIMAAVIQEIRERYPDADIIGITFDAADTQERHSIPSFPLRRGGVGRGRGGGVSQPSTLSLLTSRIKAAIKAIPKVYAVLKRLRTGARLLWLAPRLIWTVPQELRFVARCYAQLKGLNLLIVAGSNQLNDYFGGAWGFPYDLLKWCALAKWRGAKVAFLCCGAGPLDSWLGKRLIKYSLSWADSRSYRDEFSWRLIERIGVAGDNPVCTDLAYGLRLTPPAKREPATPQLMVGINPFPFFDGRYWPEDNPRNYQGYVRKLADFAVWLHERGHSVSFFPTQLRADTPVIQDIRELLKRSSAANVTNPLGDWPISSLDDLLRRISMMDIVVATRYHGVLLSAALHRPLLAISYYEKTRDLMAQIGQSDCVADINAFDANSLAQQFVAIQSRTEAIRAEIAQRTGALQQVLAREYDRVFGMVRDASRVGVADERVAALARLSG